MSWKTCDVCGVGWWDHPLPSKCAQRARDQREAETAQKLREDYRRGFSTGSVKVEDLPKRIVGRKLQDQIDERLNMIGEATTRNEEVLRRLYESDLKTQLSALKFTKW